MATIVNVPKHNGWFISKIRGMFEHRAEWLYLIYDEARKKGIDLKLFAPEAIYRCGSYHGALLAAASGAPGGEAAGPSRGATAPSLVDLRKKTFSGIGKRVFEMKVRKSVAEELYVEFHYCPLVSAWKKQGASDEDMGILCDIAMRGDAGIARAFGARLELGDVIAKGGRSCQVRFVKE